MSFKSQLADHPILTIFCAVAVLFALAFFIALYVSDFRENRHNSRRKRQFDRSVARARKNKRRHSS